jgi:succinate-acetate transporter protein
MDKSAATSIQLSLPSATEYSNPALIGLLGFIVATYTANLGTVGIIGTNEIVWVGVIVGGFAQLVGGLLFFRLNNTFPFLVFTAYGFFWITTPMLTISDKIDFFKVSATSLGYWLLLWSGITTLFLFASLFVNRTFIVVNIFTVVGLALQGIGLLAGIRGLETVGGWSLIICTTVAAYGLFAMFMNGLLRQERFSLGAPLLTAASLSREGAGPDKGGKVLIAE